MSEVSEAAKAKACELANDSRAGYQFKPSDCAGDGYLLSFARYIQQVSDAADAVRRIAHGHSMTDDAIRSTVAPFILPDPDPLLEAMRDLQRNHQCDPIQFGEQLVAALARRGLEIRERGK